jgi:hypothetical protein
MRRLASARLEAVFVLLGLGTIASYAVFWLQPLWLGDFDPFRQEAQSVVFILGADWGGVAAFSLGFLIPTALYVAGLLLLPRIDGRLAWRVAIAVAIAAPLVLLFTYPGLAADVFDYLMIGRLLIPYHLNPYTHTAEWVRADPYYLPVGWKALPSVYGPAWVMFLGILVGICGKSTMTALVLAKLAAVIAHWCAAGLVYLIARRLNPNRALFAFVAYAWNPLALIYVAVDGHNDSVLLLFVLVALYFAIEKRWELSLPALMLATLIKFVPLVLFPLFIWHARRNKSALAVGFVISGSLAVALCAPFWAGSATFDGVRDQASRMTTSPAAVASFFVQDAWLRPIALALFSAGYLEVLRRRVGLVQGTYVVLLLYLGVLSFWTKPWYFIWPIGVASAIGGATFWLTLPGMLGVMASNLFGGWGWSMDWLRWSQRWGMKAMETSLTTTTLGGWLIGLAVLAALRLRQSLRATRISILGALPRPAR